MLANACNFWRTLFLATAGAGVLLPALSPVAHAADARPKQYKTWVGTVKDPAEWKSKRTTITEGGVAPDEASQEMFNQHCKFIIADLTGRTNDWKFHDKRQTVRKELYNLGTKPSMALHDSLVAMLHLTLPKAFENEDFFPAARVACLLLYGDLNSKEGALNGSGAVPLGTAFQKLLEVLKNQGGKYPTYLQIDALVGVARHVEVAGTADSRRALAQTMLDWLQKPAAEGVSDDVHNYMRRRASDVLRMLATKGPEANSPDITNALRQFAADEDARLDDRCESIRTIGLLDKKSFSDKNISTVARTIALLAAEVGRQTAAPALEIVPEVAPTANGADPADPAAAATDAPADAAAPDAAAEPPAAVVVAAKPVEPPVAEVEQAAVKSQAVLPPELQTYFLSCLRSGLSGTDASHGVASAAKADNKQLVGDLTTKIDAMVDIVKKKKKDEKLNEVEIKKLRDLATGLETIIGHGPGAPDAATEQARVP
jgi:hypothetical protein